MRLIVRPLWERCHDRHQCPRVPNRHPRLSIVCRLQRQHRLYICWAKTQATSVWQSPTKTSVLILRKQAFTLPHILLSKKMPFPILRGH